MGGPVSGWAALQYDITSSLQLFVLGSSFSMFPILLYIEGTGETWIRRNRLTVSGIPLLKSIFSRNNMLSPKVQLFAKVYKYALHTHTTRGLNMQTVKALIHIGRLWQIS